jgi:dihydrofolate reductase
MFHQFPVVIVAGMSATTRAIGRENGLLWHVPDDMKRFKTLTLGKPVIMGRKTFESIVAILGKPLPNRTNIVITRNLEYFYPGAMTATSLEEAFEIAALENPTEIHIGGGEEIYRQALPFVDRLYLTLFHDEKDGDTFFPEFIDDFIVETNHGTHHHEELTYEWIDYVRK